MMEKRAGVKEYTKILAGYVSDATYKSLPAPVVNTAKMCLLDWFGAVLAGKENKEACIAKKFVNETGGREQSSLIGYPEKSSCINAAFLSGVTAHVLEFDDVHEASILHPGAPIISAAVAAAEKSGATVESLLLSVVLGYEVAIRIGECVGPSHYRYWHTTGTCGTFGAATAAGKLFGLSKEQMVHCLGNAGTQAGGLWECNREGAMSKVLHVGKAAANGVIAATLAKNDFTGASRILEGDRGFCRATAEEYDLSKLLDGLGRIYRILSVSYKPYPCCRHTHSAVDAGILIHGRKNIMWKDITTVTVRTYSQAIETAGNMDPTTSREAKFSLPYCVSIALKKGEVGTGDFHEESINDRDVRGLMAKIRVLPDETMEEYYPGEWRASVEVSSEKGSNAACEIKYPYGHPKNAMDEEAIFKKYDTLLDGRGKSAMSRLFSLLMNKKKGKDTVMFSED